CGGRRLRLCLVLRLEASHLLDQRGQLRVRQRSAVGQLVRLLPELVVRLAELALGLDVLNAFLRLRRRLLGGRLRLVEKSHSPSYPPRMLPKSPLPLRSPPPLAASRTRRAVRENGSVCSVTCPGPVMWTRKRPSPPPSACFSPLCIFTSYLTDGSTITMQPVSTTSVCPGARSKSTKPPPPCSQTVPLPVRRCRKSPSPPPMIPIPMRCASALEISSSPRWPR